MAEHHHGKMDIAAQEKTFAGFIKIVTYAVVLIVGVLILLTTRI
jgi:hypothetical protein